MIFTFYSFKGGVGRSMALANVADALARRGLRVLAIDFDLEAPGLERYYPVDRESVLGNPGLMDLLADFKQSLTGAAKSKEARDFEQLGQFTYPIYGELPGGGRLDIMTAGQRAPAERLRQYALSIRTFDWQDFYFNWEGEAFFEWLRRSLIGPEGRYDIVLVDSRTGVTEMGGICATHLADVVIMLCAANRQNLEGTLAVGSDFVSPVVCRLRHDRPLEVLVIPARIEQDGGARLEQFWTDFENVFRGREPEALQSLGLSFRDLTIPYQRELAFNETIVSDPEQRAQQAHIGGAFERLAEAMMLFVRGERLQSHRDRATAFFEALRRERGIAARSGSKTPTVEAFATPEVSGPIPAIGDAEEPVRTRFDPVKRFAGYDGFLSYQESDREFANTLRDALAAHGVEIYLDNSGLTPGNDIAEATAQAIHHSRHLLVCAGRMGVCDWQKREIELARGSAAPIKILPLLLPGAEADIFALALRGSADLKTVDLRDWPGRTIEFDLLRQLLSGRGGRTPPELQATTQAGTAPQPTPVNPYPGLAPHGESLAGVFQPTAELAAEILARLKRDRLAVLRGAPGSGKTSLVNAGVVPAVRQGALGSDKAEIVWIDATKAEDWRRLESLLGENGTPTLLVVDSIDAFEALLLDPSAVPAFAEQVAGFASLLGQALERMHVILLCRDLAVASWRQRYPDLAARLDAASVSLDPPGPTALRLAMETAASRTGYAFEPGLLDRITQEIGDSPAALSLAQMLLPTLWQRAQHGFLTNAAYEELKGIGGAFAEHARKVLDTLPVALRDAAHALLSRLIAVREAGEFGWQSAVWEHIADQPTLGVDGAKALLWLLRHRVLTGRRVSRDEFRIELAKPLPVALLADLHRSLEEQREWLQLRQRIATALSAWQAGHQTPDKLPEGLFLMDALKLSKDWGANLTWEEQRYIAAGRKRRRRRRQRDFAVAVVVCLSFYVFWRNSLTRQSDAWNAESMRASESAAKLAIEVTRQQAGSEIGDLFAGVEGLRVYPHYRDVADAERVAALGAALKTFGGVMVEPAQRVTQATCGDIRYFFPQDREGAEKLQRAVSIILSKGMGLTLQPEVKDLSKAGYKEAKPGLVELWLPPLGSLSAHNPAGKRNPVDESELRLVQGGCAILGSRPESRPKTGLNQSELRQSIQWLDAYYIGQHEVTNEQFARFKKACRGGEPDCPSSWRARGAPSEPANHLTWTTADAYCRWAGGRLPSEMEWEKAARGTDGRTWPWGNEPDSRRYHGRDSSGGKLLSAVGRYRDQETQPYGLADMAGNVWEMTATPADDGLHIMKGGSYLNDLDLSRSAVRWSSGLEQDGTAEYLGFRCVQDVAKPSSRGGGL